MRRHGGARRPTTAAVGLVCAAVLTMASASPVRAGSDDARSTLDWQRCGRELQCAALSVPVDHAVADGERVSMPVIRAPARMPKRRIGSLVVNFGGPGDAGTQTLPLTIDRFPGRIRDRFDIVSFDPRGTGGTRPIDCVDDATTDLLAAEDPTPDSLAELERFYTGESSAVDVDAVCAQRYGSWLAAVGSRNVARDMEDLRVALGDEQLDFLGYSYGTVLGAVYAQEFPEQVRTMVLDGAVNLSATPAEERAANASGFEAALDAFLDWCANHRRCAFGRQDPSAALDLLRDRFEAGVVMPVGDGRSAGVGAFYLALVSSLYDRSNGWPTLGLALASAARGNGAILQLLADLYLGRDDRGRYSALQEAIGPIRCADRRRPVVSFPEYRAAYEQLRDAYPFFGGLVGSSRTGCDPSLPTPAPGDELGDVRAEPDAPVLIIGTTGDPATPYEGAVDLQSRIAGSRLLTLQSTEHAAYGRGIACIDDAVDRYLVTRRLPAPGTRCRP